MLKKEVVSPPAIEKVAVESSTVSAACDDATLAVALAAGTFISSSPTTLKLVIKPVVEPIVEPANTFKKEVVSSPAIEEVTVDSSNVSAETDDATLEAALAAGSLISSSPTTGESVIKPVVEPVVEPANSCCFDTLVALQCSEAEVRKLEDASKVNVNTIDALKADAEELGKVLSEKASSIKGLVSLSDIKVNSFFNHQHMSL
jgi:hypothetical protein